jgi:1-acyl-sn-glycerol-3-phosphate acyltransferase
MSGAPGWVASRAGDWSQEKRGERLVELQKYLWNPVTDYWFRKTIEGWENIPKPPTLLIGVDAGAPFVWDTWTVGLQWWRRFGDERPLHGTAHDALMAAPGVGWYFRKMGRPAGGPGQHHRCAGGRARRGAVAGRRGRLAATWVRRDEAELAGRTGFVRLAIRTGVPIVPIATVGGPDAMPVIFSGRRLAKALQLDKLTP